MPTVAQQLEAAADLLIAQGFKVVKRAGWASKKARSDIAFAPKGVVFHHTAAWETTDKMLFDTGNGKVKGPLCHFSIDKAGVITLGAAGYANHAGINNKAAVAKVLAGADAEVKPGPDDAGYSANRSTVGVEVKCPGAYNEAQRKAAVALGVALVKAFGWSTSKPPIGAHKEITRRKPGDPGDDMGQFRRDVVTALAVAPASPTPTPTPTPTPARPKIRVGVANCQSYDGDKSRAAWEARAVLMADQDCDAWLVQETTEAGRAVMLSTLGKSWKVWTLDGLTVAILFNSKRLSYGKKREVRFGTKFGHGALLVPFKTADGGKVDIAAVHVRPKSVATPAQKAADTRKAMKLAGTWPCIAGGDWAQNKPWLPDWTRTTPVLDTMDKAGNQSCDAIFTKGKVTPQKPKLIDPGRLSDHKWWAQTFEL